MTNISLFHDLPSHPEYVKGLTIIRYSLFLGS